MAKNQKKNRKSVSEEELNKRRQKSKEAMRKLRERIRSDPAKYEESKKKERERYNARKAEGKIKSVKDMTPREQRRIRKEWRMKFNQRYKKNKEKQRLERFLDEHTPPNSPDRRFDEENLIQNDLPREVSPEILVPNRQRVGRQFLIGEKIKRKNRMELNAKINQLQASLKKSEMCAKKYKKRYYRLKKENNNYREESPEKREVKLILNSISKTENIKKRLGFGDALFSQVKNNFKQIKGKKEKRKFIEYIYGNLLRRDGYTKYLSKIASNKILYGKLTKNKGYLEKIVLTKRLVKDFLSKDEHSRLCPGKRDTITRGRIKKQKRYLNDSLKNLYAKFKQNHPTSKISYATFCKFRPFWILQPTVNNRQTCMCITHAHMSLMVQKLKYLKMINENSPQEVVKSLCCNRDSEKCLERKCQNCKEKKIFFLEYDGEDITSYQKWLTKREVIVIKGQGKTCSKTIKEQVHCRKRELCELLNLAIPKFLLHIRNISHQYKSIDQIKKSLSDTEVLFHIDFSENFLCKYAEEVQSVHFGGSKQQISLHTVVVYYRPTSESAVVPLSFCTMSDDLRHDPIAICVHLDLVITVIKTVVPTLNTTHFLSDGPTTQYRNRKMFFLMGVYLSKKLHTNTVRWHYSESGHGKGAPDGVGGYIKREADRLVYLSKDVSDFEKLLDAFSTSSVKVFGLNKHDFNEAYKNIELLIPENLSTFRGTLKCHEICWLRSLPNIFSVRELTCLECSPGINCPHYGLGNIHIDLDESIWKNPENDPHKEPSVGTSYFDVNHNACNNMKNYNENHGFNVDEPNISNNGTNTRMIPHNRIDYYEVYSSSEDSSDEEIPLIQYKKKTL